MRTGSGFPIRLAVYGTALLLFALDLIFGGPLRTRIERRRPNSPESIAKYRSQGIVARVYQYPITRAQLERAVTERLWLEGRQHEQLTADARKLITYAVLNELIDHQLLRVKVKANSNDFPVSEAEIDAAFAGFRGRFPGVVDFPGMLAAQGIGSEKELRLRLAATIQQEKYIEKHIAAAIAVSDEEARAWFAANPQAAEVPAVARVRQVFRSAISRPADEAHAELEAAMAELAAGKRDFAALVAAHSEDPASSQRAGDLGWLAQARTPPELAAAIAGLEVNQLALVRSKLGWHLVEVTERRAAMPRTFEEMQPAIVAALQAQKRAYAVAELRRGLRQLADLRVHVDSEGLFPPNATPAQ
jgi:hypothetical protein